MTKLDLNFNFKVPRAKIRALIIGFNSMKAVYIDTSVLNAS